MRLAKTLGIATIGAALATALISAPVLADPPPLTGTSEADAQKIVDKQADYGQYPQVYICDLRNGYPTAVDGKTADWYALVASPIAYLDAHPSFFLMPWCDGMDGILLPGYIWNGDPRTATKWSKLTPTAPSQPAATPSPSVAPTSKPTTSLTPAASPKAPASAASPTSTTTTAVGSASSASPSPIASPSVAASAKVLGVSTNENSGHRLIIGLTTLVLAILGLVGAILYRKVRAS